ncbi:CueP family metal-binding protein [Rarobacter incanus]|uniref:Uncharacterized protein n=1 Tax=Rarobacter incanus TaxID=153494 RepID=A0A542SP05_9MICO|nr:CueP family metal-binding protein [Rarobacter incanus]TQK75987.1 hypothetical protein FB389_0631 [Rarobacter incanus]
MSFSTTPARLRLGTIAIALALGGAVLTGCGSQEPTASDAGSAAATASSPAAAQTDSAPDAATDGKAVTRENIAALPADQIIAWLDKLPVSQRPEGLSVSVRPANIVITDATGEDTVDMPSDKTYVSLAPYVNKNHDCYFHNLATCKGELANEPVHVTVTDAASGQTVIDEDATTYDNGFVGIWLPKGGSYDLVIEAAQGKATATLATTSDEDLTCLTTLKLS